MMFPVALYVVLGTWIFFCSQDMPHTTDKFDITTLGKSKRAGPKTYLQCLLDYRVSLMIMQYGACFGCELVMNTVLALHFTDNFDVEPVAAGAMALTFGPMNLFARSLGGILSDKLNESHGMQGRLWAHFISLFGQGVFLIVFGFMTKDIGAAGAVVVLAIFATFVNMAEGTSYGIVPYMIPQELPIVSAMVGAGGTLGAPLTLQTLYRFFDNFAAFKLHGIYVLFWALTVVLMRWDDKGSMFSQGKQSQAQAQAPAEEQAQTPPQFAKSTEV
jgi:NNP family nitrate/nitrite transporter-like MFS transporter